MINGLTFFTHFYPPPDSASPSKKIQSSLDTCRDYNRKSFRCQVKFKQIFIIFYQTLDFPDVLPFALPPKGFYRKVFTRFSAPQDNPAIFSFFTGKSIYLSAGIEVRSKNPYTRGDQ
jgi:hypothetical protein